MSTASKEKGKVRVRGLFGRIFSPSSDKSDKPESGEKEKEKHGLDISQPYNTVHRVHVGYDGQKFSGLPQPWMDILLREISVADQKKNPNAVVTALKYYAASLKEQENAKFMTPNSIYNQSDEDDIDITLEGQIQERLRTSIAENGLTPSTSLQIDSTLTSPSSAPNHLKKIPSPAPTVAENKSAPVLTEAPAPPVYPRTGKMPPPPPPPQRAKVVTANGTLLKTGAPVPGQHKVAPKVPPKPAVSSSTL